MSKAKVRPSFLPDWMSFEVHEALQAIDGPHVHKKETTVLRMASAIACGDPAKPIFSFADTCTANVWYGVTRGGVRKPGWVEDPAIMNALMVATERARWWVRVKQGRAIEDAFDHLVDAADGAARQAATIATKGYARVEYEDGNPQRVPASVGDILRAVDDVLDRVSELTARKSDGGSDAITGDQFAKMRADAEARAQALEQEALSGWNPEQSA